MNFLKKQSVAWVIAVIMIFIGIGVGRSAAKPVDPQPWSSAMPEPTAVPSDDSDGYFVFDDANVLRNSEIEELSRVNRQLMDDMDVVVACVTTNYSGGDLYNFALAYAQDIALADYDFIVVLDISGQNYWLVQGAGLIDLFSDEDCSDYAWNYLEKYFAGGDYGDALLKLQDALADWYYDHY